MSKVYNSAVVIIPPEEKWAAIQEIRKKYDRNIHRWMPHITLLYPFRPIAEYESFEKSFLETCRIIDPFEVSLKIFNYFSHGHQNNTLWLDPEPNDLLVNLQAEILKIVPDCDDVNKYKNGFRPHLSVGQIKGKNIIHEIIDNLQKNWKGIKFILDKIYFISRENRKTSRFEISKQFQFKKE
jgi:2'-5' RNA ligase